MNLIWNDMGMRPTKVALYEFSNPRGCFNVYSFWDGQEWKMAHRHAEHALTESRRSINAYESWFAGWREVPHTLEG